MASVWTELVIDCREPRGLADFWCAVLEYTHLEEDQDGDVLISDVRRTPEERRAGGHPPLLFFIRVPDGPKKVKNRLHLDLTPTDRPMAAEVERVLALGAARVDIGQGEQRGWTVLADPEGNEFCVLRGAADQ
ncbi:VOC family protein [Yinghuangia sp. ASG 101]|uniref:VOC family protein n=1 Tax=Yinghuangia sp. ASG 101 TaxID=2896848 RepID=UPI001E3FDB56|nr:VOC family protein [Yinghuangia sp. ASG 101]UGQ13002.1 VOC family protein [Yinghuangia sp. ASG 101]